jgi:hypothetical protein
MKHTDKSLARMILNMFQGDAEQAYRYALGLTGADIRYAGATSIIEAKCPPPEPKQEAPEGGRDLSGLMEPQDPNPDTKLVSIPMEDADLLPMEFFSPPCSTVDELNYTP